MSNKMFAGRLIGMFVFFIGLTMGALGDELYGCLTVTQVPLIDGENKDACWQDAVWGADFTVLGKTNQAPDQTRFALCVDKSNLYFFAVCNDRNAENIKALHKTGNGNVWRDECVELFLDPGTGGNKTAHLTFNPLGACDLMWNDDNESFPENMIKSAAKQTTSGWQVEAAIPFKDIGVADLQAVERWTINLAREHRHIGERKEQYSSWVYIPQGGFFTPQRFCGMRLLKKDEIKSRQMATPVKPDESLLNKKILIENPVFSPDQNGKLMSWEVAGQAQWSEEVALGGRYIITLSMEGDAVCQKAGPLPISGADYTLAVTAKGENGGRLEARLTWLNKEGGQKETSYVISNLTDKTETYTFKDKFPAEADKLGILSLQRPGKQGSVTLYSASLKIAGQASDFIIDVSAGKPDILAPEVWPVGNPAATPHIKWADPFAGKKLHAAIIMEILEREAIELAQRLEMDYDIIHAPGDNNCYAFHAGQVMSNFCGKGRNYDVIIVAADDIVSDEFADRILACVEQGAGLLYITPYPSRNINEWHDKPLAPAALRLQKILPAVKPLNEMQDHNVLKNLPLTGTSTNRNEPTDIKGIGVGNYGKGKIVQLEYAEGTRGLLPAALTTGKWDSKENHQWWEYGWALLVRSLVWVAGYEPAVGIERMTVQGNTVEVKFGGKVENMQAEVLWTSKKGELTEPIANQKPNGLKCLAYSKHELKPDQTAMSIPVPKSISCYGGIHFCNVILRDEKGQAIDFGVAPLMVESPVKIIAVSIIGPQKEYYNFYQVGSTVTAKVNVVAGKQGNFRIQSMLVDAFDRVSWQESKNVALQQGNNSMTLSVSVSRTLLSNLTRLVVAIQNEEGLTMAGEATNIFVHGADQARRNDFLLGVYSTSEFMIGEYRSCLDALMDEVGADLITRRVSLYGKLCIKLYLGGDSGIWQGAPATSSNETRYAHNIRKNCFNNPSNISEAVKIALRQADRTSFIDGIGVTIADEVTICSHCDPRDYCYCSICREGFKQYAQTMYGTIERANREWGTSFAGWSTIQPSTLVEIQKGKMTNYSLWVDYKFYMEQSFLNAYKTVRDTLVEKHPEMAADGATPLGFGNPVWHGPLMGENYYTWAKEEHFLLKYFCMVNILAYKSFNKQARYATWFGYSSNIPTVTWQPWWFAFNQGDMMVWWTDFGNYPLRRGYGHLALFSLQGSHTPRSLALKESCYDLLHGIGQIIRGSDVVKRQVALLHSQPSLYVAYAAGLGSASAVFEFRNLVRNAGYEFDFVQDEGGKTKLKDYQALVLPCTVAMSEETQKVVADFAERGGTVLADVVPGRWDDHGKPFEGGGLLENLLKRAEAQNPTGASKKLLSEVPCGKGRLICLNTNPQLKRHGELIRDLLDKAGLDKMAMVETKGSYETYGFQKGLCRYLGVIGIGEGEGVAGKIIREAQKEADAMTIRLKEKAHLYDVRAKKYLGYTDTITTEAYREKGQFYAVMPYQINGVEAKCEFDEKGREFWYEAQVKVSDGPVQDQVLRVDVTAPDGVPVRWYSGNFWTKGGKLEMRVPMALNDKPGNWKINITDVVSGESAEKTFIAKELY